ncbi:DUF4159 domain-containing protein [Tundrisphaera lichenicola]|uniref:DUF4159 domain-containing protein n=1 Tax=Tundrisphaera lichenicola TaxID=2029860 RepID=UPI003EB8A1DA
MILNRLGRRVWTIAAWASCWLATALAPPLSAAPAEVTREQVERSIQGGVAFLLKIQRPNGTWGTEPGESALVTLALLTAGVPANSEPMSRALDALGQATVTPTHETYTRALLAMTYAAADPAKYRDEIERQTGWLEQAQTTNGSWTYSTGFGRGAGGDNSNSQYALLGLNAANEAGIFVKPEVWLRARRYWEATQNHDGSWGYHQGQGSTGSMTCAGIASLVITGLKQVQGRETLVGDRIEHCGDEAVSPSLQRGIDWMSNHFDVTQNINSGQTWHYYYLYGLERVGRLSGRRFFGNNDWYREGAAYLVRNQDRLQGFWRGQGPENDPVITTSFSLLFLAKGRAPVLVNKLRHGPNADWNNDHDDITNLVGVVSRDWKHLLTWQVVNPDVASVEDMLQAPIAYFNGHDAPVFSKAGEERLRDFVEQGGLIFAEACCGKEQFRAGFEALMKRVFPEPELDLHPLAEDHAVWRSKYNLVEMSRSHPLWGIEHGCRTVVIFSPDDLSCYWNQLDKSPGHPRVRAATALGQNVIDYATGREMPADKLATRDIADFKEERPRRGALQIAKLRHAGDWNIAPLAIPNLTTTLRDKLKFDVVINHKELFPRDPSLVHFPLIYLHGRAAVSFSEEDREALRRHLTPGGGTLFADAACGSASFDASFRRFVAELMPGNPLVPIPKDDDFYSRKIGYDLADARRTAAAGGQSDYPELEGVKVDGRWAIIYSKYDLGCALQKQAGIDCKGYTHESALRIATNIVLYATLP